MEDFPLYDDTPHTPPCQHPDTTPAQEPPKEFNDPKRAVGELKPGLSFLPMQVIFEIGAAMAEGARKYGPYNWRISGGVCMGTYYNAAMRHLCSWWEGEDIDPDSGISHITKAISSLVVLRDAMLMDKAQDDRGAPAAADWIYKLSERMKEAPLHQRKPN